jgi:hypothetical protein
MTTEIDPSEAQVRNLENFKKEMKALFTKYSMEMEVEMSFRDYQDCFECVSFCQKGGWITETIYSRMITAEDFE